jgi:hypothetical protein
MIKVKGNQQWGKIIFLCAFSNYNLTVLGKLRFYSDYEASLRLTHAISRMRALYLILLFTKSKPDLIFLSNQERNEILSSTVYNISFK